jgi:hypothetical protein
MVEELRRDRQIKQEQKTIQAQAVDIMYRDYEDRLDDEAFVQAIRVLESESKLRIFTSLRAGTKRDRWLEVEISTELLPKSVSEDVNLYTN